MRHEGQTGWNDDGLRPRVLLETTDGAINWAAARALHRHGYAVATCRGPNALGRRGCPLVHTGRCELMEQADVVVHALDPDDPEHAEVLEATKVRHPETPLVVEMTRRQAEEHAELLHGCRHLRYPMTRQSLLRSVAQVLGTDTR